MRKYKVALIKQEVLPDLYVCPNKSSISEILFSSMMRVGPLSLFSVFECDYYIVKEEYTKECQKWKEINRTPIDGSVELLRELKNKPINEIPGQEFKKPGTNLPNGKYAISVKNIPWQEYEIVISLNFSIPKKLILNHPEVLWCYMVMEPHAFTNKVYFGYDVAFNHNITGLIYNKPGVIDFPYTFLEPSELFSIMKKNLGEESRNRGLFIDISCSKKRSEEKLVTSIPSHLKNLNKLDLEIFLHNQEIKENLTSLYHSKYYVKLGGPKIRGNSIIEAISSNILVLANPDDIFFKVLIPDLCIVRNEHELIHKIEHFEKNPSEYLTHLEVQKILLKHFVIDAPVQSLISIYNYKSNTSKAKRHLTIPKLLKKISRVIKN